jgi:hypothetical protein
MHNVIKKLSYFFAFEITTLLLGCSTPNFAPRQGVSYPEQAVFYPQRTNKPIEIEEELLQEAADVQILPNPVRNDAKARPVDTQ